MMSIEPHRDIDHIDEKVLEYSPAGAGPHIALCESASGGLFSLDTVYVFYVSMWLKKTIDNPSC